MNNLQKVCEECNQTTVRTFYAKCWLEKARNFYEMNSFQYSAVCLLIAKQIISREIFKKQNIKKIYTTEVKREIKREVKFASLFYVYITGFINDSFKAFSKIKNDFLACA